MECGTTIQVMTVIVIKLYRLQFQTPQLLLAIRKQTMSKLRPIEEVIHTLIETGKGRADWFEPDAEVILASSAKAIVAKALAQKDKEVTDARREVVEEMKQIARTNFDHYQGEKKTINGHVLLFLSDYEKSITPPDQTANPTN